MVGQGVRVLRASYICTTRTWPLWDEVCPEGPPPVCGWERRSGPANGSRESLSPPPPPVAFVDIKAPVWSRGAQIFARRAADGRGSARREGPAVEGLAMDVGGAQ